MVSIREKVVVARGEIYIRADGSPELGLGHLVRCMALAHMLKDDFEIVFFCKAIPQKMQDECFVNGFNVQLISDDFSFLDFIGPYSIVILDGYGFSANFQKEIKIRGAKLVCIDDLHDREYFADLIINQAPGVSPENYTGQSYTQFALGPDYALLRPAFLDVAKKARVPRKLEVVMICFGGSDLNNLTRYTLEVVMKVSQFKRINVITGDAYVYHDSLLPYIHRDSRVAHYHGVEEKEMLDLILNSDLAVVPSSGILLEVLASGIHAISGYSVSNQKAIYEGFKNLDAIYDASDFTNFENDLHLFFGFWERSGKEPRRFIDGFSGDRLVRKIRALLR